MSIKRQQYWALELLWSISFGWALTYLFGAYITLNLLFSLFEWSLAILNCPGKSPTVSFADYVYFGFITGTTVGFGDYVPCSGKGKMISVLHALSSTLAFALIVALIAAKAVSPRRTIVFSSKLVLDRDERKLYCRILNTHRLRLLNPEIRVSVTEHIFGNKIAEVYPLRKLDDLPWLDKHDFRFGFPIFTKNNGFDVYRHWQDALAYNRSVRARNDVALESRFKIELVVAGTYGTQGYAQEIRYWADDIEEGVGFKPIRYNDEDQRRFLPIRYTRFPSFWLDFNEIEKKA